MRFRIPVVFPSYLSGMLKVSFPVGRVFRRQFGGADHQQVFGVVLLGGLREVEAAGDDRPPSITMILLWAMACLASIKIGMPACRTKSADEYFSPRWLLSRMTSTSTPRLWASTRALAMGPVKEYAWTRIVVLAASISLTTASVQPPLGEK